MTPAADALAAVLEARHTVLPKRLGAPGPSPVELEKILGAAASAPDHGRLLPWRFVIVPGHAREPLAAVFERSLAERDAAATPQQREQAREKAFRAPLLMLAIARLGVAEDDIPAIERLLSAGCAIQNMLLMATALDYGSALTTGKALQSAGLRALFALDATEAPLCFVSLGTVLAHRPTTPRPTTDRYATELAAP